MLPTTLGYMIIIPKKINTKSGNSYYKLVDVKRVNGKIVQKYVGYLGKNPNSKKEINGKDILPNVERLLDIEITDVEIKDIL